MKKIIKRLGIITLVATMVIAFSGFNDPGQPKAENADRMLMVGIAYSKKQCGSSSFSEVVGYKYITGCNGGDYNEYKEEIEAGLYRLYKTDKSDITIKYSDEKYCSIILYYKEISGWNCSVKRYAVGFGDTMQEAENDAVRTKNSDDAKSSYTTSKNFYCSN